MEDTKSKEKPCDCSRKITNQNNADLIVVIRVCLVAQIFISRCLTTIKHRLGVRPVLRIKAKRLNISPVMNAHLLLPTLFSLSLFHNLSLGSLLLSMYTTLHLKHPPDLFFFWVSPLYLKLVDVYDLWRLSLPVKEK